MSRNLCMTSCHVCSGEVRCTEEPRPATEADCGVYWREKSRQDFWVAFAECVDCETKYLAWCAWTFVMPYGIEEHRDSRNLHPPFFDLSYRSSFNDEPGGDDIPPCARTRGIIRRALRELAAEPLVDREQIAEWAMVQFAELARP